LLTSGANRCLVSDLERNSYSLIPKLLGDILSQSRNGFIIQEIVYKYAKDDKKDQKIVISYFKRLYKLDLLIFTDFPEYYMPINMEWDYPGIISNSIIDINTDTEHIESYFEQINSIRCRYIQIRYFQLFFIDNLVQILNKLETSIVESIEILLPFESELQIGGLIDLMKKYYRLRNITLYGAPENLIKYCRPLGFGQIVTVESNIINSISCGYIIHDYFSNNISTISESQHHNSCLNRKISIDADGNIKNCPSMAQSFGNIKDTTLQEALDHPEFKKYWNVTKDQVAVCKDCEFRYICTDCRAYIENPEDMYSKPLKCGYNPYTCEWEEWSTNPLKQKAIDYYGMREILPEFKKTISDAGDNAPNPSVE